MEAEPAHACESAGFRDADTTVLDMPTTATDVTISPHFVLEGR